MIKLNFLVVLLLVVFQANGQDANKLTYKNEGVQKILTFSGDDQSLVTIDSFDINGNLVLALGKDGKGTIFEYSANSVKLSESPNEECYQMATFDFTQADKLVFEFSKKSNLCIIPPAAPIAPSFFASDVRLNLKEDIPQMIRDSSGIIKRIVIDNTSAKKAIYTYTLTGGGLHLSSVSTIEQLSNSLISNKTYNLYFPDILALTSHSICDQYGSILLKAKEKVIQQEKILSIKPFQYELDKFSNWITKKDSTGRILERREISYYQK